MEQKMMNPSPFRFPISSLRCGKKRGGNLALNRPRAVENFRFRSAFSLVELLMVMGVMALLLVMATMAFPNITGSSNINRAGQMVNDILALARQEAVSSSREVHAVFIKMSDSQDSQQWRGIQLWRINETATGPVPEAITRISYLPTAITITGQDTLSPVLAANLYTASGSDPAGAEINTALANLLQRSGKTLNGWASVRFRANGSTDNRITSANNFLTIQHIRHPGAPPDNYYTLQINPVTGKAATYRP